MFFVVVLSVWAVLHLYVGGRIVGVPWVAAHLSPRALTLLFLALYVSFPAARLLGARGWRGLAAGLEILGSTWMGVLFLLFATLLVVDVVTLGGLLLPRLAPQLRGGAMLVAGVLATLALAQGLRAPVVREHEVTLANLPRTADGMTLAVVSDLHLSSLIGRRWLEARIAQLDAIQPDAVLIAGDLVDSDIDHALPLTPVLRSLRAPRGVWLALGNHDAYAGAARVTEFAESAGVQVLRNRSVELAPGVRLAGIDDPAVLRRSHADREDRRVERAFAGTPPAGATLLLAHTPDRSDVTAAAEAGAGVMFCGHTHGGQIWPFSILVQRRFPLFTGRYEVDGLTLFVGRGTGTWGPRMRLWHPGEILVVRLRAAAP
ncbi:MAG TPA: metallophosphoesterase [Opitutaceae bacterium]|nr:metallophosphoesterase [Opitutaceae bacterium]